MCNGDYRELWYKVSFLMEKSVLSTKQRWAVKSYLYSFWYLWGNQIVSVHFLGFRSRSWASLCTNMALCVTVGTSLSGATKADFAVECIRRALEHFHAADDSPLKASSTSTEASVKQRHRYQVRYCTCICRIARWNWCFSVRRNSLSTMCTHAHSYWSDFFSHE